MEEGHWQSFLKFCLPAFKYQDISYRNLVSIKNHDVKQLWAIFHYYNNWLDLINDTLLQRSILQRRSPVPSNVHPTSLCMHCSFQQLHYMINNTETQHFWQSTYSHLFKPRFSQETNHLNDICTLKIMKESQATRWCSSCLLRLILVITFQ